MRGDFETISAPIGVQDLIGVNTQVSEGIDRDQHMADVGVDFAMLETFLQVVVDSFVGDFAQEGEIRHADLFLLGDLEGRFLYLRLTAITSARPATAKEGGFGRTGGLAITAFCLTLEIKSQDVSCFGRARGSGGY